MAYSMADIEMKYPRIVFLDGSLATIYRGTIVSGSPEQMELILLPNAPSIRAAKLENDMTLLDEPSPMLSIRDGRVYRQTYNNNLILNLSGHNPEWNMFLGLCNIKGQKISIGSKEFEPYYKLQMINDGLREQVATQQLEINRLRKEIQELTLVTYRRIRQEKELDDQHEKIKRIAPAEYLGMPKKEGEQ